MDVNTVLNIAGIAVAGWLVGTRLFPTKGVQNITTSELKSKLGKKNIQFIDVRTPGEFKSKHIRGFKNIPLNELTKQAQSLSKDKEVIVICQSGMRSKQASKILKKLGFTNIINVRGGMSAWS